MCEIMPEERKNFRKKEEIYKETLRVGKGTWGPIEMQDCDTHGQKAIDR
jgi:hypothetical protein